MFHTSSIYRKIRIKLRLSVILRQPKMYYLCYCITNTESLRNSAEHVVSLFWKVAGGLQGERFIKQAAGRLDSNPSPGRKYCCTQQYRSTGYFVINGLRHRKLPLLYRATKGSPNYMPAKGNGARVPVRSLSIPFWMPILATAYLRIKLTDAFQSPTFLSEKSKYADEAATNSPSRPNASRPSILIHNNNGVGVGDSHMKAISSRRGFLRDVIGLGLGVATGSVFTPRLTDAFSEDEKRGRCPPYEAVEDFDIGTYMGVWYELAFYDWTQNSICGCTRFNMTLTNNRVLDAFTTACPYEHTTPQTYVINMHEEMNVKTPGSFKEHAFYHSWDNKVVALWRSTGSPGGSESYERAIQMQCMEILGRRAFVGVNFLSRVPIVPPEQLSEMFEAARALGIAEIGGNPTQMSIVPHEGCRYPSSSENAESPSLGSGWGVHKIAV